MSKASTRGVTELPTEAQADDFTSACISPQQVSLQKLRSFHFKASLAFMSLVTVATPVHF